MPTLLALPSSTEFSTALPRSGIGGQGPSTQPRNSLLNPARAARRPAGQAPGRPGCRSPPDWLRIISAGLRPIRIHDKDVLSPVMAEWWSIEVLHGEFSAFRWQEQHDDALIEAALTNGALDGSWHAVHWGVVFEICFDNEQQWERFRSLPAVSAALDGVPDPVSGLLVYRGRGGTAGARQPRKPKPVPSADAISLPEPHAVPQLDLTSTSPPDPLRSGITAR